MPTPQIMRKTRIEFSAIKRQLAEDLGLVVYDCHSRVRK